MIPTLQTAKRRASPTSVLIAVMPLLFSPFLKASLERKPGHHRVQDETADASALSLSGGSNLLSFFSGTANQQDGAIGVPLSLSVVGHANIVSYKSMCNN